MTQQKVVIRPQKGIILTGMEGTAIKEDLLQAYHEAHKDVEERWGVSITLEAV